MEVLRSRVLLRPRDLEVSLAFYEGGLGLHRSREFGSAPHRGIVLFLGGGTELELHEGGGPDPGAPLPTGVRLWLQVPDVDAAVAQLSLADVVVTDLPEQKAWGLIEAVVHDPDGLPLVLVEVPTDHPLRRDRRGHSS
ncbi:VOC family protein [Nitriliruptor alkaliphilus]|uniref:VOC family protein n=1 Tax=Nitriliruptor alkaliphilus TaxID=427918 RepID=UPI000695D3B2|nr:VOC family protein [Nitriliruptor alkaliphilus]